jgi:hypothetical protein
METPFGHALYHDALSVSDRYRHSTSQEPIMKNLSKLAAAFSLVLLAGTCSAHAGVVPEIDPASGMGALTLIAGATMILRSRKR